MTAAPPAYSVPPVERAFKLLRAIAAGDSVTNMSATARTLALSRTTLLRLIATLEAERMIERNGVDGGWRLGLGLASLAGDALGQSDIVQVGGAVLRELTAKLSLSSHIGVLDGRDVLYVARQTPNVHLVSNVRIGSRLPAHATTLGRIMLAHLPREDVRALFHGVRLKSATAKTPTTLAALMAQIDGDRTAGIAWSNSNFEVGIGSAAAAVFDQQGRVAGAVNVTGPSARFEAGPVRQREIGAAVTEAARTISMQLGHRPAELEHVPLKWSAGSEKKARSSKDLERRSDAVGPEFALARVSARNLKRRQS